jgi:hypothetical protein
MKTSFRFHKFLSNRKIQYYPSNLSEAAFDNHYVWRLAERVALLPRVWELPALNLHAETRCSDFYWFFLSPSRQMTG